MLRWMISKHDQAMEAMIEALKENTKAVKVSNLIVTSMQMQLGSHDLTVTGINPSTGGDDSDRAQKAYAKYNEWLQALKTIQKQIETSIER